MLKDKVYTYFLLFFSLLSSGFLLFGFPVSSYASDLYIVRGANGSVTITNRVPKTGAKFESYKFTRAKYSRYSISLRGRGRIFRPVKSHYDKLILKESKRNSLDPSLVKAVVHVESAFRPQARSPKGAQGLMQLMPATARRFQVRNAFVPQDNVAGGTKYLRLLLDRYNGNERLALAAYNAGEGAVDRFRGIPPYGETQDYVRKVLYARNLYRCGVSSKSKSFC